jgi:hypothetical protein
MAVYRLEVKRTSLWEVYVEASTEQEALARYQEFGEILHEDELYSIDKEIINVEEDTYEED